MHSYLVEAYAPKSCDAPGAADRAREGAEDLSREGVAIRYVRTTYLPEDETCFHFFEAESAEVVEDVCSRAELGRVRIVAAVEEARQSG